MTNNKIDISNIRGDVIGFDVDGNGNIIGKNINIVINEARGYGLALIDPNHFKENSNTDANFESWKNGFNLSLESIYYNREYRREIVLEDIKKKLESENRLLLLGESGFSKTTLLMEVIHDYFDKNYKVLYSEGNEEPKEPENITKFIRDLVRGGNKVLVAIDNVHDKKMASMFYVINLLQSFNKKENVLFLLSARQPEYDQLLETGNIDDSYREAINSLFSSSDYIYEIKLFDKTEIKLFIEKYKEFLPYSRKQKSLEENATEIFEDTRGLPIMVKFSVLGEGLVTDVKNRYYRYLVMKNEDEKYPDRKKIEAMIVVSLFHLSTIPISNHYLEKMGLMETANKIDKAIIFQNLDNTWKTIHPRWDLELFSFLLNFKDKNFLNIMKQIFQNAVKSIFKQYDQETAASIIETMYDISAYHTLSVPVDVVDFAVTPVLQDLNKDIVSRLTYHKLWIYATLPTRYNDAIVIADEIIKNNVDNTYVRYIKGITLDNLEKYEEAVECFDRCIEKDGSTTTYLLAKSRSLLFLEKYSEAADACDLALDLDPSFGAPWFNKAAALEGLKKYEEAIKCYDKLTDSPVTMMTKQEAQHTVTLENIWSSKGFDYYILEKYEEAIKCCDRALEIDQNYIWALNIKGQAFYKLGKYEEAIECFNKAIERDSSYANAWYSRSSCMVKKGEINQALKNLGEAIKLDQSNIESAKTDKSFDSIRNDERFKKLIGN